MDAILHCINCVDADTHMLAYHTRLNIHDDDARSTIPYNLFGMVFFRCIVLPTEAMHTTKSVVSLKKDYKIPLYPSKIPRLFGIHMYAIVKTHVTHR